MTMEVARWQPTKLPDGWGVRYIEANVERGGRFMDGEPMLISYRIRLEHLFGWHFEFETYDPATINEVGLASLLDALAHSNTGVVSVYAEWSGRR